MKHINLFQLEMMEVRMVDVKLYSIIRLNVVVQNIHRSLNRDALDSCDFYQLSPPVFIQKFPDGAEIRTRVRECAIPTH